MDAFRRFNRPVFPAEASLPEHDPARRSRPVARRLSALVVAPMTVLAFAAPTSLDSTASIQPAAHGQTDAPSAADAPSSDPAAPTGAALVARTASVAFGSSTAAADVPSEALVAYHRAATVINASSKTCRLPWQLLAAVGQVESDHGRRTPPAATPLADTDAGLYDGSAKHDLPIGPLQLTPQVWAKVAVDADGDGERDATDLDDAALGLAVLLCSSGASLDTADGQRLALGAHNTNRSYVDAVLSLAADYAEAATVSARMTPPVLVGPAAPPRPATPAAKKKAKTALRAEGGAAMRPTPSQPGKTGKKPKRPDETNEEPAEEPTDQPPADGGVDDSDPAGETPETPTEPEPEPGEQPDEEACLPDDETDSDPADDESGDSDDAPAEDPADEVGDCADPADDGALGSEEPETEADRAVGQKSRRQS